MRRTAIALALLLAACGAPREPWWAGDWALTLRQCDGRSCPADGAVVATCALDLYPFAGAGADSRADGSWTCTQPPDATPRLGAVGEVIGVVSAEHGVAMLVFNAVDGAAQGFKMDCYVELSADRMVGTMNVSGISGVDLRIDGSKAGVR